MQEGEHTEAEAAAPAEEASVADVQQPPRSGNGVPRGRTMAAQVSLVAVVVVLLLTAIFVLQNVEDVDIDILFWTVTAPLAVALILALALGGLIASLVMYIRQRQVRHALEQQLRS